MSIENFKNPWVDEWKRGEKLHPDWLGGEKVLSNTPNQKPLEVIEVVEYYASNGTFLGKIGNAVTGAKIKIVNDEVIESKGGIENVKKNLIEINKGIIANKEPSASYKSWYDRNSTDAYRENELYDFLKNWGDEYILKSIEQEWGCAMFYKSFTDSSGKDFIVFVVGNTTTSGLNDELSPHDSGIYINGQRITIRSGFGWKSYAFVHTHPYGGDARKKFSAADYMIFLDYNMKGYMFAYGSRNLLKFYPKVYNDNTPFKWRPFEYFDVNIDTFDKIALLRATRTTYNVLNEYDY